MTIGWKGTTPKYHEVASIRAEMVRRFGQDFQAMGLAAGISKSAARKFCYDEAGRATVDKITAYLEATCPAV